MYGVVVEIVVDFLRRVATLQASSTFHWNGWAIVLIAVVMGIVAFSLKMHEDALEFFKHKVVATIFVLMGVVLALRFVHPVFAN
jgi:hypothetical protein